MSWTTISGLALGVGLALSLVLLTAAMRGWQPALRLPFKSARQSILLDRAARRRAIAAAGAGVVVLVLTRWPVAAGAIAALIYLWPTMFGGGKVADSQVDRVDALATWTESLRDSIAGSVGLEDAIRHSLTVAPPVLVPALERLDGRLRVQIPLPQALALFAEEFADSSADLVIAALILNSQLRGPGLLATLTALADAGREEIDMRRRIEEGRKSLRRTALIIVGATTIFAGGLAIFSRQYVAPYSTPLGQVMLTIVLGVFAGGLMWIRAAANLRPPARFLVSADQLDGALAGGGVR